jgi:isopentenyl-diphosphate delta-isomerase
MKVFSNKVLITTLAVNVMLWVAAFFIANVEMPGWAHYVSGINVVLFAAPTFWAATRWLGRRDGIILFVILGILALAIETVAIVTGFPYGHFGYSELLGYRMFGYVPWTVALAWTPLLLTAYTVAKRIIEDLFVRILVVAVILVVFDCVLDPGAVRLGFWRYQAGGVYYGVPWSNFGGWIFSGAIGAVVIESFTKWRKPLLPIPAQLALSGFFIMSFWTAIAFFSGMVVPLIIGLLVMGFIGIFYTKHHYAFDDMIVMVDDDNNPIGTAQRRSAHDDDTKLHRAFSAFIFNKKGELLLQQRALSKKTWPGVWSNSCCGHVMLHESTEAAVRRRLKYELGLNVVELESVLPDFRYRAEKDGVVENEICPVFVGFSDNEPTPNPDEVNDVRWVPWAQFAADVKDPANGYSPWAMEEVELLLQSAGFRALGVESS